MPPLKTRCSVDENMSPMASLSAPAFLYVLTCSPTLFSKRKSRYVDVALNEMMRKMVTSTDLCLELLKNGREESPDMGK